MKRITMAFLLAALSTLAFYPADAGAEVDININIGVPLPKAVIVAPPAVVVIPGTYVYFAPDVDVEILFYGGYWWRPHAGRWYRAMDYNGPWIIIEVGRVPNVLVGLPPGYRSIPPGHERIPYGQLKKHWKEWEREKRWGGKAFKREMREERREHKGKGKGWK